MDLSKIDSSVLIEELERRRYFEAEAALLSRTWYKQVSGNDYKGTMEPITTHEEVLNAIDRNNETLEKHPRLMALRNIIQTRN